jgi:tetratricopeptide (TPR) repeat protein
MTEEIGNRLTQLGRLQVKARGLVDAQWRRTPDPFDAARRLNVAWFVHGNVRHAGTQLLVNVELVRAGTGEEVWASRFPRSAADVFAVQAEVAESVAVVVGGRLSPVERAIITRRPTRDNEAWRLYVYGNALLKRRTQLDVRRALEAYTEAVRRDAGFAQAWAGVGRARSIQHSWSWDEGISQDSLLVLGRVAARRALALDSSSTDAWAAVISSATDNGDFARAHAGCQRALRLDSLNGDLYHVCGDLYGNDGLKDGELSEPLYRRELALDPDHRNTWRHLTLVRLTQGRLAEAEALADTTLSLSAWGPAYALRAYIRFLRGNGAGALADQAEAERMGRAASADGLPTDDIAHALYAIALGDSAAARGVLARARAARPDRPDTLQIIAMLSMALGLRAEALDALERYRGIVNPREPNCTETTTCSVSLRTWFLLRDPIFAPLQREPRFVRLMQETRPRAPWLM